MGVSFFRTTDGPSVVGVWEIVEETHDLLDTICLSPVEQELFEAFRTDTRRKQWLAYRHLLRELISPEKYPVHYDDNRKPFLAGNNRHISVTHTDNFAGVIVSPNVRVGIDMEKVRDRIDRVKEKFLSEPELAALGGEKQLDGLTLAWCAKETLYKICGLRNLDFRDNIRVYLPDNNSDRSFPGSVTLRGERRDYRLFYERSDDLFVVWAAET